MRWKLLLLVCCLLPVFAAQAQESSDLFSRLNNLRAQRGVPAYSLNGSLSVAAQQQAQWIVDTGTVAHTHPDGSGPRTRALAAGYPSTQISENIYGGTNATVDSAWSFWLNSAIHFQGMVSTNYQEVGIGIARGSWGASYVLVFGGVGAPPPVVNASNGGGQQSAPQGPPAYVGGVDEHGNIKHIVQPGDTLGDIALIYGYTWSDLPYMMQLNGLADVRDLEVGSTFLVPPRAGTYTPAPNDSPPDSPPTDAPAPTDAPPPTGAPPTITPFVMPTLPPEIVELTVIVPALPIATAGGDVLPPDTEATQTPEAVQVAAVPTLDTARPARAAASNSGSTSLILIAIGIQVVVVVGAGIEFMRRALRKRR